MIEPHYRPKVRTSLLGFIGYLICWATALMLAVLPYYYWQFATVGAHFSVAKFTPAMILFLGLHLLLIVVFLIPSMSEKYLRSSDSVSRKIGVRIAILAVALLLALDGVLLFYRQNVELPAILAGVTKQQWIMALSIWILLYFGFLFSPGAYLRELNVRYEARKLRLPFKTGIKIIDGKGYFFPIGEKAKQGLGAFSAQTNLPLIRDYKEAKLEIGLMLLGLPLLPVFIGVVVALKRGTFLPNETLYALSLTWMYYATGLILFVLVLRAGLVRTRRNILISIFGPPVFALALWPLAAERGVPLLHAYATTSGGAIERVFTVLPQPDLLNRILGAHCVSPLLVADNSGAEVYLCGLKIALGNGVQVGSQISLQGWETDYGFYHEREVTVIY